MSCDAARGDEKVARSSSAITQHDRSVNAFTSCVTEPRRPATVGLARDRGEDGTRRKEVGFGIQGRKTKRRERERWRKRVRRSMLGPRGAIGTR